MNAKNEPGRLASALCEGLGPGAKARWYVVSRDGLATLCADGEDAQKGAETCNFLYPRHAPHRAMQMVDAGEITAAVAAERERPRQVVAYMATNREGEVRFTDNPNAARELEGYGWAITPLADAGPNVRAEPAPTARGEPPRIAR